jgi:predicted dehydrogenase
MTNVAVVGLGFMGVTHLKAYLQLKNARIAAICDAVRLPVAGDFSSITGNIPGWQPFQLDVSNVKVTKDLNEVLADPAIDLIDLCVPTPAHVKLSTLALQAGKHVVCEKPLARNSRLAREIVDVAAASKGYFMPAMCMRFWPGWSWLKEAVAQESYGRVKAARFRRVGEPPSWGGRGYLDGTASGGALLDLHIHDTDFVQFVFGRPKAVYSQGFTFHSGAIDHIVTQYTVANGAAVSAEGSWMMGEGFGFNMSYTVMFERATVDYDLSRGAEALKISEPGKGVRVVPPEPTDGYIGELGYMVDCIGQRRPPTRLTAQDGLSAVEICEAEEESVRTGQVVSLATT